MNKARLREELKRQTIPQAELDEDGRLAALAIRDFAPYQAAKTVACYMPMITEPNVLHINRQVLSDGKRLLLPRVISQTEMAFFEVTDFANLKRSAYGILEPEGPNEAHKSEIDLMIMPALALTHEGVRLGMGKGYYDRYLQGTSFPKLVPLNKNRLILGIMEEKHDIKVNYYMIRGCIVVCGGK